MSRWSGSSTGRELGGYDLSASPNLEEQDLQISEDVPSVVVTRSCVWAGNVGIVSVTPILLCGCSQGCSEQTQRGASCLLLRNRRSPSRVSVRGRTSFYLTSMVWFPWRSIRAISALRSGMLRSTWMATQFLAIREVYGCISVTPAAGCFCKRPT